MPYFCDAFHHKMVLLSIKKLSPSPPSVPGCVYSGSHYEIGEEWLLSLCEKCVCTDEGEMCAARECEPVDCSFTYVPEGECCPVCANNPLPTPDVGGVCLTSDGRRYSNGEKWSPDPCNECMCLSGETQCLTTTCFPLVCMNESSYYVPDGMCCPMCKGRFANACQDAIFHRLFDNPVYTHHGIDQPLGPGGPTEMAVTTLPSPHPSNQPRQTVEPGTSQTQLPASPSRPPALEIILMVNLPYREVAGKLNDFSARLNSVLGKYYVEVDAITVVPHDSSE